MKPENAQRDRQALEIFGRAIEVSDATTRAAYLDDACGGDATLKARVEALLASHVEDTFLEKPAAGLGPGGTVIVPVAEKAGDRIGRYKLLQPIGEGGCGVVYMAEQEEPVRRRVALKVIKQGMDTAEVIARFEAERQALAMMDHPGIARVFDAGATDTGRPYFVMELVRGTKITDYCDERQLSTRARLELFTQVCSAVQHAHQKGIIHRDLKPSNILVATVDGAPMPKVIDFGIAKATNQQRLTEKTLFTAFQQFIGTPAYTSPEQAEMSGVDIDTRSDIYSLGVVLYELLTGRTPFDPGQLFQSGLEGIRRTLREQEPSKPSTALGTLAPADLTTVAEARHTESSRLLHQVSGDLDWVVMKCLEKDRARRYETATGLAQDVLRHLQNEPVAARPPSAAYKLQKAWRRNKLAVSAAAAVAAALVVGLGFSTWAFFQEREARTRAHQAEAQQSREREKAERARQTATTERDHAATLLSISQARQGVELLEKGDPTGLLYLLEARKSVEHLPEQRMRRTLVWSGWLESLPKPEPPGVGATSSPGGGGDSPVSPWQAMRSTNGLVTLLKPGTAAPITTFKVGNGRVSTAELSANGRLLMVNVGGTFKLWDLAPVHSNQPPRQLASGISRHAFDPNRRRIVTFANEELLPPGERDETRAAAGNAGGFQMRIWDSLTSQALVAAWEGNRQDLINHQFALSPDGTKVAAAWKSLTLWNAQTGRQIGPQPDTAGVTGSLDFFNPPVFSPNGRWLWEIRDRSCRRYDLTTGKPAGESVTNLNRYLRPWVSPNGQHLVLTLANGIRVVQLDSGDSLGPMIHPPDETSANAVALSSDGLRLATTGPDRAIRIWDTRTGQTTRDAIVPPFPSAGVSFSPDRKWLVASARDGRSQSYRVAAPAPASIREIPGRQIFGFNPAGQLLVHTVSNRMVQWTDPATARPVSSGWPIPGRGSVISSAFSPDGTTLALAVEAGRNQSLIQFWNTATGAPQEPAIGWTNTGSLAFSPDGRILAGLAGEGVIQFWTVANRAAGPSLSLPKPWEVGLYEIQFNPAGTHLATRSGFKTWHVWDRQTGLLSEKDIYTAISPDWKLAQADQGLVELGDPRSPRPAPKSIRGGMAFSPDGRLLAVSLPNNKMRLWNVVTGSPVGHEMKINGIPRELAFSPDSRVLVILEQDPVPSRGSSTGRLRLWETETGLAASGAIPGGGIGTELAFDREARFLVTHGRRAPHRAQIWKLPAREVPLEEMERQSWLMSGSRLDDAGNVEPLPGEEIRRLEASRESASRAARQPVSPVVVPPPFIDPRGTPAPQPAPGAPPLEVNCFIGAGAQPARSPAMQLNREFPPEIADFHRPGTAGDRQQAGNSQAGAWRDFNELTRGQNAAGSAFRSARCPAGDGRMAGAAARSMETASQAARFIRNGESGEWNHS